MIISDNIKYTTRSSLPVRILCHNRNHHMPIVGLVTHPDGTELARAWYPDGKAKEGAKKSAHDLLEVLPWSQGYKYRTRHGAIAKLFEIDREGGRIYGRLAFGKTSLSWNLDGTSIQSKAYDLTTEGA